MNEVEYGYCPICEQRLKRTFVEGIWWCEFCEDEWRSDQVLTELPEDEEDEAEDE
jgi:ribosomal protein L37AE/L43A